MINYLFEAVGYTYKRNDAGIYDVLDEILLIDKLSKDHYVTLFALYSNLGASPHLLTEWRKANKVEPVKPTYGLPSDPIADLLSWGLVTQIKYAGTKTKADSVFGVTAKGQRILTLIETTIKHTTGSYAPPVGPTLKLQSYTIDPDECTYSCSKTLFAQLTAKNPDEYHRITCDIYSNKLNTAFTILDSFGIANGYYQILFSLYKNLGPDLTFVKPKALYDLEAIGCIKSNRLTDAGTEIIVKVLQIKEFFDKVEFTEHKLLDSPATLLSKLIMDGKVPSNTAKKTLAGFYPYVKKEGFVDKITNELSKEGLALQQRIIDLDKKRCAKIHKDYADSFSASSRV